jgi:hypothetical protein
MEFLQTAGYVCGYNRAKMVFCICLVVLELQRFVFDMVRKGDPKSSEWRAIPGMDS